MMTPATGLTSLTGLIRGDEQSCSALRRLASEGMERVHGERAQLERRVRRGEMTLSQARAQAAESAAALREKLTRARSQMASRDPLVHGLAAEEKRRLEERARPTLESLQRETNRLLRATLVEQQIQNRRSEFEAMGYLRPLAGGPAAPSLDRLLAIVEREEDEPAREWARRQLSGLRERVATDRDRERIEVACRRPEEVSAAAVTRYVRALGTMGPAESERFLAEAIAAGDASACCASYLAARAGGSAPDAASRDRVACSLKSFPAASLAALAAWEQRCESEDQGSLDAVIEETSRLAAAEAELAGVAPPSREELQRLARFEGRPPTAGGEPIGLALQRRGLSDEEYAARCQAFESIEG